MNSYLQKKRAMNGLILLTEKRDGTIIVGAFANGSTQRSYIERDKAISPTVSTEAPKITSVIGQNREEMWLHWIYQMLLSKHQFQKAMKRL